MSSLFGKIPEIITVAFQLTFVKISSQSSESRKRLWKLMKAEFKPNYDTNRKKLADIIPLAAPFTVYIEQPGTVISNVFIVYMPQEIKRTENFASWDFR